MAQATQMTFSTLPARVGRVAVAIGIFLTAGHTRFLPMESLVPSGTMVASGTGEKLKVFISYSRRDSSEFVDELVAGLELAGFASFLDRHDIAPGEKWEDRLGGLIAEADTVVFVVSPEAVKSERCAWEVAQTQQRSKRLLPVVFRPVPETDIPEMLRERQFVRFDVAAGITRPLRELAQALRHDIDWVREHTRIGEMAARWEARGRLPSLLLRGEDVAAAEVWMKNRKPDASAIGDTMRTFIAASKEAEAAYLVKSNVARGRIIQMQALVLVLLVLVIVGLLGWINQDYIKDRWRAYTIIGPYVRVQVRPHVLSIAAERALTAGDVFAECAADCPQMIVVPAGQFVMGSAASERGHDAAEEPEHIVTIPAPFAVSKFEVTFAEWDNCVEHGDCAANVSDSGLGRGNQPVINVAWGDAKQYVAWLSHVTRKTYRLLSEAEWEYAARAGTQTAYYWGNSIGTGNASCEGCGSRWDVKQPAPVGAFAPNAFGLYDMEGNVWQYLEDCFHPNYDGAPKDGSAWLSNDCTSHILRAGAYLSLPKYLRNANRVRPANSEKGTAIGFRIARTLSR